MGVLRVRHIAEKLQALGRSRTLDGAEPLIEDLGRELGLAGEYLEGMLAEREVAR